MQLGQNFNDVSNKMAMLDMIVSIRWQSELVYKTNNLKNYLVNKIIGSFDCPSI